MVMRVCGEKKLLVVRVSGDEGLWRRRFVVMKICGDEGLWR